jgi:hypothetical protein
MIPVIKELRQQREKAQQIEINYDTPDIQKQENSETQIPMLKVIEH